jgi:hypothetical protein
MCAHPAAPKPLAAKSDILEVECRCKGSGPKTRPSWYLQLSFPAQRFRTEGKPTMILAIELSLCKKSLHTKSVFESRKRLAGRSTPFITGSNLDPLPWPLLLTYSYLFAQPRHANVCVECFFHIYLFQNISFFSLFPFCLCCLPSLTAK